MKTIISTFKSANIIRLLILTLFLSCNIFISCTDIFDEFDKTGEREDKELTANEDFAKIKYLQDTFGFKYNNIKVNGDQIIVEDDMVFERKNFWELYFPTPDTSQLKTHKRQLFLVSNNISSISVVIKSTVSSSWVTAVKSACTEWNDLNGRIKFSPVQSNTSTSTGINITTAAMKNIVGTPNVTTIAQAKIVTLRGYPGNSITINTNATNTYTASMLKEAMVHEIGHCIGFYHTDSSDGYKITGISDSAIKDPNSVMTPFIKSWAGFSKADKEAFYKFYSL